MAKRKEDLMSTGTDGQVLTGEQVAATLVQTPVVGQSNMQIAPFNAELAFQSYSPQEQAEIMALSNAIDVSMIDKIMNYGIAPTKRTFEQCGEYLKKEKGSTADQNVMAEVVRLSKEAGKAKDDFDDVLKEPNIVEKAILAITTSKGRKSMSTKIRQKAITNYDLVFSLAEYCEKWKKQLQENVEDIDDAGLSDLEDAILLEKYIIAGDFAAPRIEDEVTKAKEEYQNTGSQQANSRYLLLEQGKRTFEQRMSVLKDTHRAYRVSMGQLALTKGSNLSIQTAVTTQTQNAMTLMAQQLRNAVLNAKNQEVIDGQKALRELNNKLILNVSKGIGATAEESAKLVYAAIFDEDVAKQAVQIAINAFENIKKIDEENMPRLREGRDELDKLLQELNEVMVPVSNTQAAIETGKGVTAASVPAKPSSSSGLAF